MNASAARACGTRRRLLLRPDLPRGKPIPLRVRSIVGLIPLFAVGSARRGLDKPPGFRKRMQWFLTIAATSPAPHMPPRRGASPPAAPAARHAVARAALRACCVHARRERVPLALRRALALRTTREHPFVFHVGRGAPRRLQPGRVDHTDVRRQLQLARARSGSRSTSCSSRRSSATTTSTATSSRSSARRARGNLMHAGEVADELSPRLGASSSPTAGRRPCHGRHRLRRRPALARPRALPRVLPRRTGSARRRPRLRRQPPDRLDRLA
jgi:hypothetical protein